MNMDEPIRLIGGPGDGKTMLDGLLVRGYVEVTAYGDKERTAIWAPGWTVLYGKHKS